MWRLLGRGNLDVSSILGLLQVHNLSLICALISVLSHQGDLLLLLLLHRLLAHDLDNIVIDGVGPAFLGHLHVLADGHLLLYTIGIENLFISNEHLGFVLL